MIPHRPMMHKPANDDPSDDVVPDDGQRSTDDCGDVLVDKAEKAEKADEADETDEAAAPRVKVRTVYKAKRVFLRKDQGVDRFDRVDKVYKDDRFGLRRRRDD